MYIIASRLAVAGGRAPGAGWRIVGSRGGGALFHPTKSPHGTSTPLSACDMGVMKV